METSQLLSATGIGRRFGDRWVFRNIDIALSSGQCLCLLGNNGSGKSTMLKVLVGIISASEGQITRPCRNEVGYAALDLTLYSHLTAQEHIDLFARFRGLPHPGHQILVDVGLEDSANNLVGTYSTGMRARLKLALATFYKPKVLLLDEPSAAMDEIGLQLISKAIQEQLQRGSVIIATNDKGDRRFATHELELGS